MSFTRKYLSADGLHKTVKHSLLREQFKEMNSAYTWQDCIMSGLAVFGFKFPSLLQFEKDKAAEPWIRRNLRTLYGVEKAPSDTCMRERLDIVSPRQLRRPFKKIFADLQRGKALESYRYLNGHYIFSLDGTGQFSSEKVHCECCCEKHHRNGRVEYYHHMLGAVLVHPERREVIPLAPEPIVKGDGESKNDCERNAANYDYRVNVLEYWETKKDGRKQHFTWVTKLPLTSEHVYEVMRAGRARWKIENETFNTLKNQGYNFQHNYGHGYKNLCSTMTMLMMLAFLIDPVQQLCCKVYQQARKHIGTLRRLFEKIQHRIDIAAWDNWHHLLTCIGDPASRPPPSGSAYIIA